MGDKVSKDTDFQLFAIGEAVKVANLIKFSVKQVGYFTAGLTAVGLLATTQTAVRAETLAPKNVQNLACVQQGQKLICDLNSPSAHVATPVATQNQNGFEAMSANDTQPFTGQAQPTYLISTEQDEFISNVLLGFLYLVLPVGFGLTLWLYDRNSGKRLEQLNQHVALLERIWHNHPLA